MNLSRGDGCDDLGLTASVSLHNTRAAVGERAAGGKERVGWPGRARVPGQCRISGGKSRYQSTRPLRSPGAHRPDGHLRRSPSGAAAGRRVRHGGPAPRAAPSRCRTARRSGPPPARRRASRPARSPKASWVAARDAGMQPGRPHPDQAEPGPGVQPGRRVQRARGGVDGCATSVGSGSVRDRVIVVKLASRSLITTVRATAAGRPQAARGPPGQPEQLAADHLGVVHVGWRTSPPRRRSSPARRGSTGRVVPAPGQRGQVGAGGRRRAPAAGWPPGSARCPRTVRSPSRASTCAGLLPHAPQRGHRQRVQEVEHPVGGTTSSPSGLHRAEASLATNLVRGHPDRAGDALLLGDRGPDQPADPRRAARAAGWPRTRPGTPRPARAAPRPASPTGRRP